MTDRRWITLVCGCTLGVILIVLGAGVAPAVASSLHRLASGTVAFSSDGTRFASWQQGGDEQIVVLDTVTGQRKEITPPTGCTLHNEAEDGEPIISAAAGRFLLDCEDGTQALLDVQTSTSVRLPAKAGGLSNWYRVGTRYVMGVNVLYDIATGVSTRLKRPADLDARGASMKAICPALRDLVSRYQPQGLFKSFGYQGELFARGYGKHGDVQLDRCHGHPTILTAHGTDDGFGDGQPQDFDLRGGLLSWDTGSEAASYIPPEPMLRGGVYAYELATHRRHEWLLPRVTVRGGAEPLTGTFGYSTHIANTVFWIASRTLSCYEVCGVETSSVYATALR